MKHLIILVLIMVSTSLAFSQDFNSTQQAQEKRIKAAYKSKKLSDLEYSKLMEEQKTIKDAIQVAKADGVMTPKEKNAINSKLNRAEKRLIKYKGNAEIY